RLGDGGGGGAHQPIPPGCRQTDISGVDGGRPECPQWRGSLHAEVVNLVDKGLDLSIEGVAGIQRIGGCPVGVTVLRLIPGKSDEAHQISNLAIADFRERKAIPEARRLEQAVDLDGAMSRLIVSRELEVCRIAEARE